MSSHAVRSMDLGRDPADGLSITIRHPTPRLNVIEVSGEINGVSAAHLRDALVQGAVGGGDLVVDLGGVSSMVSAGVHLLVEAERWSRVNGASLVIGAASRSALRVLRLCGALGSCTADVTSSDAAGCRRRSPVRRRHVGQRRPLRAECPVQLDRVRDRREDVFVTGVTRLRAR